MKTTSFELSKKLKEVGVKQFGASSYHVDTKNHCDIACFTLDEILEMLPGIVTDGECNYWKLNLDKGTDHHSGNDGYVFSYGGITKSDLKEFIHPNPAEAAGQLLLWCIENGYVEVGENEEKKDG
jgi:hypothetical protein